MMHPIRLIIYAGFLFMSVPAGGQILTLNDFIRDVVQEHPRSKEIQLAEEKAYANLLKAKGGFDPLVSFDLNQKEYEQKSYYQLVNGQLKLPTSFGVEFKSGYEWSRGLFLNPESITPGGGLMYAGASMPLGRGLLIDEKRARRSQAKIGMEMAGAEIQDELNAWIFEAVQHYLQWQQSFISSEILSRALETIDQRRTAVIRQVNSGDRPAIDTVEIGIQRQLIELSLRQAELETGKAKWKMDSYGWKNNQLVGFAASLVPENTMEDDNQDDMILLDGDSFRSIHPALKRYDYTLRQLTIERRFTADKLKPGIILSYNPLFEPVGNNPFSRFRWDNQKWGLSFSMPLFLRKERGDLKKVDVDLLSVQYKSNDKFAELYTAYQGYRLEYLLLKDQFNQYQAIVKDYETMYNSEKTLFTIGESSLFLVNAREQVLIQAELKRLEFAMKMKKAYFGMLYAAGSLPSIF